MIEQVEKVREALEALGSTSDEVAQSLRDKGITGNPSDSRTCPVSNLIRKILHGNYVIDVGGVWASWHPVNPTSSAEFLRIHLPTPTATFICRFDLGVYADLRTDV